MDLFFNVLVIYWIVFSAYSSWTLAGYKADKHSKWVVVGTIAFALLSLTAGLSMVLGWEGFTDISVYLQATYMPVLLPSPTSHPDVTYPTLNGFIGWICMRLAFCSVRSKQYLPILFAFLTTVLKLQSEIYVINAAFTQY